MAESVDLLTTKTSVQKPEGPTKLLNWNFILLWQGLVVSALGSQFYSIAVVLWIKQVTGSATILGTIMVISNVPRVILSWVTGTIVDRHSRRTIIIVGDLIRGIAVLSLAALLYTAPNATEITIYWVAAVSLCIAATSTFFGPAVAAAVPDLVPEAEFSRANSLRSSSSQIVSFLGQGLGGLLFRLLGMPLITLVNGVTYIFSAISEWFITIPQNIPERESNWQDEAKALKEDFIQGFRFVWDRPGLKVLVLSSAFMNFFTMPIITLLPFYVEDFLGLTTDWYGYLLAVFAVGVLAGSLLAGFIPLKATDRPKVLIALLFFNSAAMGGLGFTVEIVSALALALLVGASIGFNSVHMSTLMQLTTPSEMRGRVFGLMSTLSNSAGPLGIGLAGVIFDQTGQNIPLLYGTCGLIMVIASIIIATNRNFRQFLATEPTVAKEKVE